MTKQEIITALDNNSPVFESLGLLQKFSELLVNGKARANVGKEQAWIQALIEQIKANLA